MSLVVQEGSTIDGVSFDFNVSGAGGLSFNGKGDIVFTARKDNTVSDGLFAYVEGELKKIVLEGELFDVDPGPGVDNRTISTVRGPFDQNSGSTPVQSGGEDGGFRFLNDTGQFVHRLDFTDGSHGIFLTTMTGPCAWDCDGSGDGAVSVSDLLALLAQYDPMSPSNCTGGSCDFDSNGCVDVADLLSLLAHYDPAGTGTEPWVSQRMDGCSGAWVGTLAHRWVPR